FSTVLHNTPIFSSFFCYWFVHPPHLHSFLHDALPISHQVLGAASLSVTADSPSLPRRELEAASALAKAASSSLRGSEGESAVTRSEEHTSELQSLAYLVCRLLLEKKKKINHNNTSSRK